MLGLYFLCFQNFILQTRGAAAWDTVSAAADHGDPGFEALLSYDPAVFDALFDAACLHLRLAPDALLEDLGTFLVTAPDISFVRRLLRFGGATFDEFLHSCDDLPDRVRLALPDLSLPQLRLRGERPDLCLEVAGEHPFWPPVLVGILRAMADEYGALALLELTRGGDLSVIGITIADDAHAPGRDFDLGATAADRRRRAG